MIGGGPAGSTAAALLAAAGRSVVLFEKEIFPRFHIGESLLPFNMDLLRRLGILDRVAERFVEKRGAHLVSSDGGVTRDIIFAEGFVPGHPRAYQVLRSSFDELLLRNAADKGARVYEGHAVIEAAPSHHGGCAVTARGRRGGPVRCRARFLLDASGRDAFMASRLGLRDMVPHLRKAAVFAHYEDVPRAPGPAGGNIVLVLLRDGWFWFIPLPGGTTSVGLVAEGAALRRSGLPPETLLEEALRRCPAAHERTRAARRISPVWTASDYSYGCREIAGDGYLLLGDAAAFIDPLFSTGVWLAMSSAEIAADTLDRALGRNGRPARLSPSTFAAYERRVRRHVRVYTRIVSRFYQPGFLDVFLRPGERFRIREAVVSLLAGMADPTPPVRLRLWCFYFVIRMQQAWRLNPPVPLLGVLERPPVTPMPA
ncbi:MAG: hypothetical protein AUH92_03110 [Acidobacteria bacterium 13_1_40CM_4_69_4]|nr:MAG: hypothetical protein AUH92_03110 [Acidobacteria bacterium 13_1_40CM_4_69_4]